MIRALVALSLLILAVSPVFAQEPIDIASRRELFVDRYIIDKLTGTQLRLHAPTPAGVAMRYDKPWEGPHGAYTTVIKDGPKYRMYYRGMRADARDGSKGEAACYAESSDGITWTKPNLGLFTVDGSKENNVVLTDQPPFSHNFSPLLDTRPGVAADERYKALAGLDHTGLVAFASADGLRWRKLRDAAVIKKKDIPFKVGGTFDSQNLAFWSDAEQCYVCYFRVWDGIRRIARTTSKDFLTWTPAVLMEQVHDDGSGAGPRPVSDEHLYTNQTTMYARAPHIYLALPSRFMDGRDVLTQEQKKELKVAKSYFRRGAGFSDMPLMSTRGGTNRYDRTFLESWIRPGPGLKNWTSRANYPACGIVETQGERGPELSIYVDREVGYPTSHVARYTLRLDGFVSVNAPYAGGEMLTKPLKFSGKQLAINVSTSAVGSVRVEIQDAAGKPLPGFALDDCPEIIGDETDRVVTWKSGSDVSKIAGQTVRMRFVMKDADVYAIQFSDR